MCGISFLGFHCLCFVDQLKAAAPLLALKFLVECHISDGNWVQRIKKREDVYKQAENPGCTVCFCPQTYLIPGTSHDLGLDARDWT